ncbi:MAG TPA: nitroreductase family protein [Micromonosporaceae bacterium]|nr:nitroreductase family protein [Micromonosporaceae bacterium]
MEFAEVVRRRRMVRNYDADRPVSDELVDRLLDCAIRAPSAGFSQGWGFLVLTEPDDRARFWTATTPEDERDEPDPWLLGLQRAPVLIVALSNKSIYLDRYAAEDKGWTDRDESRWPVPYWDIDTGFAALMMMLAAVDNDLATCFFGIPPEQTATFRATFDVPSEYTPIGALSVGYPAADRRSPSLKRGRRPLTEVVHRGHW